MAVKSKWVGSNLVYYDDYEYRWVKAFGPDVREWEIRYGQNFTDDAELAITYVDVGAGTSAFTQAITAGNRVLLTTAQNENDGGQFQTVGTGFQLASGHPLYFGIKCAVSDATQSDFFAGLASLDTTLIAAHALGVVDNGIYFSKVDGGTVINATAEKAGTEATDAAASAMTTASRIYEIYFDGTTCYFYLDGTLVSSTTAWPTVVLAPSFGVWAGAAAEKTATIEWMRCIQL